MVSNCYGWNFQLLYFQLGNIALPRYGVRKFLMVSLTISTETHGLESNKTLTFWVRPENYCVVVFCLWDFSFYNRVDSKKLEQWNKHSLWLTQSGLRGTVIFSRPRLVLVPKPKYFSRPRPRDELGRGFDSRPSEPWIQYANIWLNSY